MTRRFFLSILVSIVPAAVAPAQMPQGQQQSVAGVVKLNRAPVSNEVLKVKLPRPVERQLSNGLRLLVLESHRTPSVSLTIQVPSSHLRDAGDMPGVAEATAALMMTGTPTRTARQITEQ